MSPLAPKTSTGPSQARCHRRARCHADCSAQGRSRKPPASLRGSRSSDRRGRPSARDSQWTVALSASRRPARRGPGCLLRARPARRRCTVAAKRQPCPPSACRVATAAAGGNGCGFQAGDLTPGTQGHHEQGHVPCSALPEAGNLAAGLGGKTPGCGLADLYYRRSQ